MYIIFLMREWTKSYGWKKKETNRKKFWLKKDIVQSRISEWGKYRLGGILHQSFYIAIWNLYTGANNLRRSKYGVRQDKIITRFALVALANPIYKKSDRGANILYRYRTGITVNQPILPRQFRYRIEKKNGRRQWISRKSNSDL